MRRRPMTSLAETDRSSASPAFLPMLFGRVAARWWLLPLGALVGAALALFYLARADYSYTATLKVYAAPASSGSRAPAGLGGLAALAGLAGPGSENVSPFRFYLDGIYSPEVAARLARDPALMHALFPREWDAQNRRWRQPQGPLGRLRVAVMGMLGLPQFGWTPPDANRLQGYIADEVSVLQSVRTPVVTITYDNGNPALAARFLGRLHGTVDGWLREQQTARTRGNIAYLADKLATVTLAEQRTALVNQLAEQERQAMLAHADAPYAADPFDRVTASLEPTRPRPVALLLGALVAGLMLGLVLAVALPPRAA